MTTAATMGLLVGGFAAILYGLLAIGIPLMLLGFAVPLSLHFKK